MTQPLPIPGLSLRHDHRALYLRSDAPLAVLSSAVVGGMLHETRHIVNMQVPADYRCGDHVADLHALASSLGIEGPFVGMLTAARLDRAQVVIERGAQAIVVAAVTLGIRHPVASGVTEAISPAAAPEPDTINTIVVVEGCLSNAARVNAVIAATEAKTLALVEGGVRAPHGGPASGTGTDAIVVASTQRGPQFEYAGPIAPVGALIGRAVRRAVQHALAWR